jgi:hypothetical protein
VVSFITLGWLGMEPVTKTNSILARVFTVTYFGFFILMPWFTSIGKTKEVHALKSNRSLLVQRILLPRKSSRIPPHRQYP